MDTSGPTKKRKASLSPVRKGRGRPSKWSESLLKVLVILRLCGFELGEIIELIRYFTKGHFQPKLRNSQQVLQDLLSNGYLHHCAVDSETLRQRVRFIKQVKAARQRQPNRDEDRIIEAAPEDTQIDVSGRVARQSASEDSRRTSNHQIPSSSIRPVSNRSSPNPESDIAQRTQSTAASLTVSSSTSRNDQILRHVLRRGSRTSSCISEIVSLLGRFSITGSGASSYSLATLTAPRGPFDRHQEFHPILRAHIQQCHDANAALIASCKGCTETKDCLHQTIMQSITAEVSQRLDVRTAKFDLQDQSPFMQVDPFGNNLLFFAARSGAPLSILLDLIHYTPNLHTLNDEGQSFLFVLDPAGLADSRYVISHFSSLIGALEKRAYDFDHLDCSGRSFLSLLCVRPEFNLNWMSHLCNRSVRWMSRMQQLARHRDCSGAYLVDYVNSHPDAACLILDIWQIIRKPCYFPEECNDGSTPLHYEFVIPISRPAQFPSHYEKFINRYDKNGNTPLHMWARATKDWMSGDFETRSLALKGAISVLGKLIGMGANINAKDRAGNTALHLVTPYLEIDLQRALLRNGALPNLKNSDGYRPIDYVIEKLQKHLKKSSKSHVQLCAKAFTCAWNLLEHGAQFDEQNKRRRSESSESSMSSKSSQSSGSKSIVRKDSFPVNFPYFADASVASFFSASQTSLPLEKEKRSR